MKNQLYLKYPCVSHEVYASDNLDELTIDWPKISCTQNWGTNKVVVIDQTKEKVLEIAVPKDLGFAIKSKFIRIDITIEAEGLIDISNIDFKTLSVSESLNGLVTKMTDNSGNEVIIYGKNKLSTSNTFGGQLKDKFNSKTIYLELKGDTYKSIKVD
jgi:hypothetical protein